MCVLKSVKVIALFLLLFLTACAPQFEKEEEVVQETDETREKAIIPRYNISDSYYRTILPFKEGEARGLVLGRLNTRLDIDEFETGLMRVAQESFEADRYLYQEGQYLKRDTIRSWLGRKLSKEQLEEQKLEENENVGLNPIFEYQKGKPYEEQMKDSPIYLTHMLEHNYLIKNKNDQLELAGVVIGLALNSVHYYKLPDDYGDFAGFQRETEIDDDEIEREGKKIAEEVIGRLRNIEGLKNVPITIALFKQESISSIVPGHFFASASADADSSKLGKWQTINEEYHVFPSTDVSEAYREDAMMFSNFKSDIDDYFPNYTGVIGRGFYKNDELQQLTIEIPMQFYGKGEVIGFTQYLTGLVMEHFPNYINVHVYVSSESGQESMIIRDAGAEEPYIHIYN